MNDAMTTAANVVAELQALGLETRPLTGREFPVPMDIAADVAYRWRLLSIGACRRVLRAAFPHESDKMIDHWAGNNDIQTFHGELGQRIRDAVAAAIGPRTDILREAVLGRRMQHALAGVSSTAARELRPLDVVRSKSRRTAERQEAIDALEHGAMATRFA